NNAVVNVGAFRFRITYNDGGNNVVLTRVQLPKTKTEPSSGMDSVFGQPVTFTATVTAAQGGTPTGIVTFRDGTASIGTGTLNSMGQATLITSTLSVASHTITATYEGDANFLTSTSGSITQVV